MGPDFSTDFTLSISPCGHAYAIGIKPFFLLHSSVEM